MWVYYTIDETLSLFFITFYYFSYLDYGVFYNSFFNLLLLGYIKNTERLFKLTFSVKFSRGNKGEITGTNKLFAVNCIVKI